MQDSEINITFASKIHKGMTNYNIMDDFKRTADGYAYQYPRAAITTDCVIFGYDGYQLRVLLIRRGGDPFKGYWALPGGFLNMDESVEQCAFRELYEETGLEPDSLEQFGVFSALGRDPRGRTVSVAFYGLVRLAEVHGGDDAAEAQWFDPTELPDLAFDHFDIIKEAFEALKRDIHYRPIGFNLLEQQFSIPQLQRLYESILGVSFDRRNFQKKVLSLGILNQTNNKEKAQRHRAGKLYTFNQERYNELREENVGKLRSL